MILTGAGWTAPTRPVLAQSCSNPAACPAPTTGSTVTIDCGQLDAHTFIANQRVDVRPQANCTIMNSIDISVSNVIVRGTDTVTIRPAAGSNVAAFRVQADRVLIENFNLVANSGTRFFTGIVLSCTSRTAMSSTTRALESTAALRIFE